MQRPGIPSDLKPGDVVFTNFPQADMEIKVRPAIVLKIIPPFNDLLVCAITSRFRNHHPLLDDIIASNDDDFASSGLQKDSMIRLGSLITYERGRVQGPMGHISEGRLAQLQHRLASFLTE